MLKRQRPRVKNLTQDQALLRTITDSEGNVILTLPTWVLKTTSAKFDFEPGSRMTLGRILDRDMLDRVHSIEFSHLGFFDWNTSARARATERIAGTVPNTTITFEGGSLFGPFPSLGFNGGFDFSDEHEIRYGSQLHSFELNYRLRRSRPPDHLQGAPDGTWTRTPTGGGTPSFYGGLRYVKFDERFSFRGIGLFTLNNDTFTNAGDYSVDAENQLLGLQMGADLSDDHVRWCWGFRGNAGVYANWARQESRMLFDAREFVNQQNQFFGARNERAAFVGEFGLVAGYRFQPHMTLRASYDMMWIQGLALAPEQLKFEFPPSQPATVGMGGHLFFQGFSLGMEMEW